MAMAPVADAMLGGATIPVAQPERTSDASVTAEAAKRESAESLIDEWADTKYLQRVQNG
jgi:hypothetical protein